MIPAEFAFRPETYKDKDTGRKVTRIFPHGQDAVHAYFTSTSYDAEGRLILEAKFNDRFQLCRADLNKGTLHVLTELPAIAPQLYCVSPAGNIAIVRDANRLVKVDLESCKSNTIFSAPAGWAPLLPTIDAGGKRVAFAITQDCPNLTATEQIYSTAAENFYFRPHSMVGTIDIDNNRLSVIWGETEWISHVLINPVDPDTVVFCHEGGGRVQHRLWVVDARSLRKKQARLLYHEQFEEFLVHEYFLKDGTLGVQLTVYDKNDAQPSATGKTGSNSDLFLRMDGRIAANLQLPGQRSGHVQSNSNNTLIVADCYYPDPDFPREEGRKFMALNIPKGDKLKVEKLCFSGTSWRTQMSHPHPIFSPDDKQVLFSSEINGSNSVFIVNV